MAGTHKEPGGMARDVGLGEGTDIDRSDRGLPGKTQKQTILDRMEEIKEMVGTGMTLRQIAPVIGVSLDSLKLQILLDPGAAHARAGYFAKELFDRYDDLKGASNGLEMSKAREALNHLRAVARVRSKEFFGEEPGVQINIQTPEQAQIRIRQLEQELGITYDAGGQNS